MGKLRPAAVITVTVGYEHAGRLESELREAYPIRDVRYDVSGGVALDVAVPEAELEGFRSRVADRTAGSATTVRVRTEYVR